MPTLPPQSESNTQMLNRQQLDRLLALNIALSPVVPPLLVTAARRSHVVLWAGTWPSTTLPTSANPPVLSATGQGACTALASLTIPDSCQIQSVSNLTVLGPVTISATARVAFNQVRFEGPVTIQAGGMVAFTDCDFASPTAFVDNAGLAADVTITGGIHRNATAHVNTTTVNELVV